MEKFTIDIDKVLDDFEETEALTLNKHKKVDESLQTFSLGNLEKENELNVNLKQEEYNNFPNLEDYVDDVSKKKCLTFEKVLHSVYHKPMNESSACDVVYCDLDESKRVTCSDHTFSESVLEVHNEYHVSFKRLSMNENKKISTVSNNLKCQIEKNIASSLHQPGDSHGSESHISPEGIAYAEQSCLLHQTCIPVCDNKMECDTEHESLVDSEMLSDSSKMLDKKLFKKKKKTVSDTIPNSKECKESTLVMGQNDSCHLKNENSLLKSETVSNTNSQNVKTSKHEIVNGYSSTGTEKLDVIQSVSEKASDTYKHNDEINYATDNQMQCSDDPCAPINSGSRAENVDHQTELLQSFINCSLKNLHMLESSENLTHDEKVFNPIVSNKEMYTKPCIDINSEKQVLPAQYVKEKTLYAKYVSQHQTSDDHNPQAGLVENSHRDEQVHDECVTRDDNDSGVSSEEDTCTFVSSDGMLICNDVAQSESSESDVLNASNSVSDNVINLVEKKQFKVSGSLADSLVLINSVKNVHDSVTSNPVTSKSNDFTISSIEVCSSNNVETCQSPIKFTGARPKVETLSHFVENVNILDSKCTNYENMDFKTEDVNTSTQNNSLAIDKITPEIFVNTEKLCLNIPAKILCDIKSNIDDSTDANSKSENVAGPDTTCSQNGLSNLNSSQTDSVPQRLQRPTTLDLPFRNHAVSHPVGENDKCLSEDNDLHSVSSIGSSPSDTPPNLQAHETPLVTQQPRIGSIKPFWIPDSEAPNCMHCGIKFTVIKRRHHCRACGKVLCSRCCNLRAKLAYLNKEDRICNQCFEMISTSPNEVIAPVPQISSSCDGSPNLIPSPQEPIAISNKTIWRPHPNNPDDYCSTIPPLQQVDTSETRPPPTVLVPIGVLKRGNKSRKEPKQVIFSDGIRPGGDLTDLTDSCDVPVYHRTGRKRIERMITGDSTNKTCPTNLSLKKKHQKRALVSDEEGPLPPLVLDAGLIAKSDKLNWNEIIDIMQDDNKNPINFALLKNIHLFVKLTKLDCCFGKECWCFTSHGFHAFGQDEVMVILERLQDEKTLPRGIIKLYTYIYDCAIKGSTFDDLGHIIFPEQILGSSDHRGFLFIRPTFQCLSKLILPNTPFLVAILIHKWEVPWAKVFPLRLMLRLGAECRYYPCALVSIRHRKPLFFEIGQTIMSVLADLRNFQFTIPVIPGLLVHMEEKKTFVNIPRNHYDKVMKVLNSNNVDHVLALGSNFSSEADSHLVCVQKEEGDYQTQAINIENTTRKVTGASFIVFSGALKTSSGLSAKFSIVEDGILVQIPPDTMVALHIALRDMKDLTVKCGEINAAEPEEVVIVQWTKDDRKFNIGVLSPIDRKSLEGIPNLRIHNSTDYAGDNFLIRWTEVFFLEVTESENTTQDGYYDPCHLAETVAQSCCMALVPYLDQLLESDLSKIGLRMTLDSERDKVGYDIGSCCKPLPAIYMNALDCALIPVISRLSCSTHSEPLSFELIFHILAK